MRPILFQIWRIPVYSYGFSLAVAFILATVLAVREGRRRGIDPDRIIDLALYVCVAGILGARLLYVILELPAYIAEPANVIRLKDGGLSFFGGLFAAILVGIWFCRRSGIQTGVMADIAAPLVALGYSIVRVGCFLNGCCYGVESSVPWAMAAHAGDPTKRHPTQIYAAVLSLAIFFILLRGRGHKKFPGYLMFLYVGLYSISRFIVEIFRDVPRLLGPFSIAQLASVVIAVAAFWSIAVLSRTEPSLTQGTFYGGNSRSQG